ncbi:hypothetical protein E2C01_022734 [Portunus trituberculatus]|uniref:Uncharacterized protein n=1 Tax=Portunus trituberculatus TaxID=210409 RepID=A0A5B7E822_PORTR|nr:hypothetical protein [Portunus trituberculatus]
MMILPQQTQRFLQQQTRSQYLTQPGLWRRSMALMEVMCLQEARRSCSTRPGQEGSVTPRRHLTLLSAAKISSHSASSASCFAGVVNVPCVPLLQEMSKLSPVLDTHISQPHGLPLVMKKRAVSVIKKGALSLRVTSVYAYMVSERGC